MSLENIIFSIREKISCGEVRDEKDVTALIVNPLLEGLGWLTADKNLVTYEHNVDGKKVDLALSRRKGKQEVFIEVKRIGAQSKTKAEKQIFGYLSEQGVPIAVLAYGYEWCVYHPYGPGKYEDRKIADINLLRGSVPGCVKILHKYLDCENVTSGAAAGCVLRDAKKLRLLTEEKETFYAAMNHLVEKRVPFSKIGLSQEYEDICGRPPASRDLDEFIKREGLPPNCLITPLGTGNGGKELYVMDARGRFNKIKSGSMNQDVHSLYSPHIKQMAENFPYKTDMDEPEDAMRAAGNAIRNACWMRGELDLNNVRGLGTWPGDNGELILHTGSEIMVFDRSAKTGDVFNGRKKFRPGKTGRHIYPNETGRMLKPAETHQLCADEGGPGAEFMEILNKLDWARPAVDPYLFMGLCGCAMISGALQRRPSACMTGPRIGDVGELTRRIFSTLEPYYCPPDKIDKYNGSICDQPSLVLVETSHLNTEAHRKEARLLRERVSTEKTPPVSARRGAPMARSGFLFVSHEHPLLATEDNLAVLKFGDFARFTDPSEELGARAFRRIIDGWPMWKKTFAAFYDRLTEEGHNSSMAAQYAALLTAADLIMEDHLPSLNKVYEMTRQITSKLPMYVQAENSEKRPEFEHVLSRVLAVRPNGERMNAADLIRKIITEKSSSEESGAGEKLGSCGMRVVSQNGEDYLAVANKHPALKAQFAGTPWGKTLRKRAAWSIELGRIPNTLKSDNAIRFDKYSSPSRAVLVPLAFLFEDIAVCRL